MDIQIGDVMYARMDHTDSGESFRGVVESLSDNDKMWVRGTCSSRRCQVSGAINIPVGDITSSEAATVTEIAPSQSRTYQELRALQAGNIS